MSFHSVLLLFFASVSAAVGQMLFKLGASGRVQLADFFNLYVFFGLFLYGLGTVAWIYALSYEKLSNVFAFTALTFVLVYAGSVFFLGERLNTFALLGVLMVVGGLFLITVFGA